MVMHKLSSSSTHLLFFSPRLPLLKSFGLVITSRVGLVVVSTASVRLLSNLSYHSLLNRYLTSLIFLFLPDVFLSTSRSLKSYPSLKVVIITLLGITGPFLFFLVFLKFLKDLCTIVFLNLFLTFIFSLISNSASEVNTQLIWLSSTLLTRSQMRLIINYAPSVFLLIFLKLSIHSTILFSFLNCITMASEVFPYVGSLIISVIDFNSLHSKAVIPAGNIFNMVYPKALFLGRFCFCSISTTCIIPLLS